MSEWLLARTLSDGEAISPDTCAWSDARTVKAGDATLTFTLVWEEASMFDHAGADTVIV